MRQKQPISDCGFRIAGCPWPRFAREDAWRMAAGGFRTADVAWPRFARQGRFRVSAFRRRTADGPVRAAAPAPGHKSAIRNPQSAILVVLVLSAGGLFGCAQSPPQRQYYLLEAPRPAAAPATGSPATLVIRPFRMDTAFVGRPLVYRVSEFRYESDYYHQFLIPPAAMLEEKTRDWLADSGLFAQIVAPGSAVEATHTLSAHVTALYGDFADRANPQAVLEIRFTLLGAPGPEPPTLLAQTYRAAAPIADRTADAVVAALNQDLVQILAQLEADLRQRIAEPEQRGSS